MCEPCDEHDSRGSGWYCCLDNRWNDESRRGCVSCGQVRYHEARPATRTIMKTAAKTAARRTDRPGVKAAMKSKATFDQIPLPVLR